MTKVKPKRIILAVILVFLIAGIGRYRPERGGHYGRFKVNDIKFEKVEL